MKIDNYATGERAEVAFRLLLGAAETGELPESVERLVLLPIPSTRDGVHISGSDIRLCSVLSSLAGGDGVVCYGLCKELCEPLRQRGVLVYDAAEDEDFLLRNAELTALGTLGYILTSIKRSPCELDFGIVGYGRIGRLLLRYLVFFGARVKVFTTRGELRGELFAYGVSSAPTFNEEGVLDASGLDILINTAPTDIRCKFGGESGRECRVLELASGNNLEGCIGVERLPSVPERRYPTSAGEVLYEGIMRSLKRWQR